MIDVSEYIGKNKKEVCCFVGPDVIITEKWAHDGLLADIISSGVRIGDDAETIADRIKGIFSIADIYVLLIKDEGN